ncbi:MAG: prolipoprotein diacylglyceryl transferase [Bacteroidia bacterium]|nr:prolipoprotein diacylglyceryl transferase [Bacteroidia bacterium]
MEKHVLIDISNGSLLYQIFYVLAFVVAYVIIFCEGYKRKFPLLTWVLIIAGIRFAVVIGTKIFTYSAEEWRFMLESQTFLPNNQKTMFGGFLLGTGAYLLLRYLFNFRHSVWDTVAIAFPAAVSIQSMGCFFYGCCFGKAVSLPWAVRYPVMSLAHYHQFESGAITFNDLYSLPVHPVQLYQCLGGLLVIILVIRFRKYWKAQGSILLSSIVFFTLIRFIIEFFRDPLSNKTGGEMLWVLKQVQWQYLIFAVLMTLLLFWREKTFRVKPVVLNNNPPGLKLQIAFLCALVLIFLLLRGWFTLPEIIALNIALLPALLISGIEVYRSFASLRYRWIYALILLLPLLLMSQTLPSAQTDSTTIKKAKSYHSIGGGIATGDFIDAPSNHYGEGCDRVTNTRYFNQKYTIGGIGYSYTKETPEKYMIRYGVNTFFGKYSQNILSSGISEKENIFGINPCAGIDSKWIGGALGLHIGNLYYSTGDREKESMQIPVTGSFHTVFFPQFYFRFGEVRTFFGEIHIADQFPVSTPGLAFQFHIGTGFGLENGLKLRFGTSLYEHSSWLFSAYIPIENRIIIEPLFLWSKGEKDNYEYPKGISNEKQFSVGLSYRFGHKY